MVDRHVARVLHTYLGKQRTTEYILMPKKNITQRPWLQILPVFMGQISPAPLSRLLPIELIAKKHSRIANKVKLAWKKESNLRLILTS